MKKRFTLLLIFISLATLNAQNNEIEDFVNQTCLKYIPKEFEYFNLLEKSYVDEFDEYSLEQQELKELLNDYPDFPYLKFIEKAEDTTTVNWKSFKIQKARVYNYKDIPKFLSHNRVSKLVPYNTPKHEVDSLNNLKDLYKLVIPVKKHWGQSKLKKEIDKKWNEYEKSIPKENRVYFRFSTPIIIGDYALVTYGKTGSRKSFIYKKVNGFWELIHTYKYTVS